jgi:peroxiredoxin Q/BCP
MTMIKEGVKAPAFKGKDQNGKIVSLSDFKGKNVILYFYPQDDTPGCTAQACNLRDHYGLLKNKGFEIVGVSPDEMTKHKKFENKYDLPFTLLADPERKIIEKYGVWGEKSMYGKKYMGLIRTTFIIDSKGVVRKVFSKPKTKEHSQEILEAWNSMNKK